MIVLLGRVLGCSMLSQIQHEKIGHGVRSSTWRCMTSGGVRTCVRGATMCMPSSPKAPRTI
ncbi:hypothetical protein CsSME_00017842 [Camellia sinensis var. sinensis]